jgi:hypothetical protein
MPYLRNTLIALLLFSTFTGQSQVKDSLVQFSGIVVTADSVKPVPFTHIAVMGTNRGTMADYQGFFSFVAMKGETITFSAVGFKPVRFIIPDSLNQNRYSLIQVLQVDTITLSETIIYPWPHKEHFKKAFLETEVPMDDYDRAIENLDRAEMKERLLEMGMDAGGNYRAFVSQQSYNASMQGLYPVGTAMNNPLLSPTAWYQFIKAWKEGKFRKQD